MSQIINADQQRKPRKPHKTNTTIVKASLFKLNSAQEISDPGKLHKMIDESEELQFPSHENFEEINEEINKLNDWNLNIWNIKNDKEKFKLVWIMFHSFNFFEKIEIDQVRFSAFLSIIRTKYNERGNPFHNFDHGFSGSKINYEFFLNIIFFNLM